jgi:hypothetical protein
MRTVLTPSVPAVPLSRFRSYDVFSTIVNRTQYQAPGAVATNPR